MEATACRKGHMPRKQKQLQVTKVVADPEQMADTVSYPVTKT